LKGSAAEENPILFSKVFHRFHYIGAFNLFPPPFKSWYRRHLFNVVRKIDYGLVAIKKPDNTVSLISKQAMMRQFDECLRSRIVYGKGSAVSNKERNRHFLKKIYKWWLGHD
jgi:hypothetical protein